MDVDDAIRIVLLVLFVYVVWRMGRGLSAWGARCARGHGGALCKLWRLLF